MLDLAKANDLETGAPCRVQGYVFEKSCAPGLDSREFALRYMNSKSAWQMDLPHHQIRWHGQANLLRRFPLVGEIPTGEAWDPDVMFWIGYVYRQWREAAGVAGAKIVELASPDAMRGFYPKHHSDNSIALIAKLMEKEPKKKTGARPC